MSQLFKWQAQVRDYEVVEQGIVANANYLNYYEQCRIDYLRHLNIHFKEFYNLGYYFVVSRIEVDFIRPLKANDEFYVTCEIISYNEKWIMSNQEIKLDSNDKLVSKCYCVSTCVSLENHKACMPVELEEILNPVCNR